MKLCLIRTATCLLAVVLVGNLSPCFALNARKHTKRFWAASVALVIAANALDIASSRGMAESNPLLRTQGGTFNTGRAVLIKSSVSGGVLLLQALTMRRHPNQGNIYAVPNVAGAAALSAVAIRNWSMHPAATPPPLPSGQ